MNPRLIQIKKRFLLSLFLPLLAVSFNTSAAAPTTADATPKPGIYCADRDIQLVVAEELSASLDMVMSSRAALINKDKITAVSNLSAARATLYLAASRGAAARTTLLIDTVIQAKTGEDYAQLITWFPLIKTSLSTIPDDATVSAANKLIAHAQDIMSGDEKGDSLKILSEARHMLACDRLDIPLQQALLAQDSLVKQLDQDTASSAYDALSDALRNALSYTLKNSEN